MRTTLAVLATTTLLAGGGVAVVDAGAHDYTEKGNTYELVTQSRVPGGKENVIEISKTEPEVRFKKWDGEVDLGVRYEKVDAAGSRVLLTDRVEWKGGAEEVHAYPLEATEQMEDGGFEIEVVLNEPPATNVFEFAIHGAENLDFFYQPELTPEEIEEGASRPENVVGSYAVYHKEKRNHGVGETNYATGKAYHIFRPKVVDADGSEVWGELSYKDGVLSVTVPEKYLSTAIYPVRVDPTFGYTSQGASDETIASGSADGANAMRGDVSGTVSAIAAYVKYAGATADRYGLELRANNSGVPGTVPTYTSSLFNIPSTSYTLVSVSGLSEVITNPYWVSVSGFEETGSGLSSVAYDTGGAAGYGADRSDVGIWSTNTKQYSIYATYAASSNSVTSDTVFFD